MTGGQPDGRQWKQSSSCNGGNCVEVESSGQLIAIRDSADPDGVITFPSSSWRDFVADVKAGKLGSAG